MVVENELTRPWRGAGPVERVAERRAALLAAALEVFTARGFADSRVRDVCRTAGLTERYFYESFANKEALLLSLARDIVADLIHAAGPGIALVATDVDSGVAAISEAAVRSLTDDPRRARVLFVEVVGVSAALEDERRVIIAALVGVIREGVAGAFGSWARTSPEVDLVARALIGAAQELLIAFVRGELAVDQAELIQHVGRLFLRARPVLDAMRREAEGART